MLFQERLQACNARIADIRTVLNNQRELFKHKAVRAQTDKDEYEGWVKECCALTKEVQAVATKRWSTSTPQELVEYNQMRLLDILMAKLNRQFTALEDLVADAKEWVIDERMRKKKQAEWRGKKDKANSRFYWLWLVNDKKYTMREDYTGKLYVVGTVHLDDREWHFTTWDTPVLQSEFEWDNKQEDYVPPASPQPKPLVPPQVELAPPELAPPAPLAPPQVELAPPASPQP